MLSEIIYQLINQGDVVDIDPLHAIISFYAFLFYFFCLFIFILFIFILLIFILLIYLHRSSVNSFLLIFKTFYGLEKGEFLLRKETPEKILGIT